MSPNTKYKKSISLLFIFNLSIWIVLGSKLENPDWKMWIDTDDGQLNNKRITAKSVFVAPLISKCSDGYRQDNLGRCVKITTINHSNQWKFLLDKLNSMFASPKPESSSDIVGSEPFKLNIPINNNVVHSSEVKETSTGGNKVNENIGNSKYQIIENTSTKYSSQTGSMSAQIRDTSTRKTPTFTTREDFQTDFTNKNDFSTNRDTTKTEWNLQTKPLPESTTLTNKYETVMWITEKPKKPPTQTSMVEQTMTTPYLPTTIDLNSTADDAKLSTLPLNTETTVDNQATSQYVQLYTDHKMETDTTSGNTMESTYYPSTSFDKLTTFPSNKIEYNKPNNEHVNKLDPEPSKSKTDFPTDSTSQSNVHTTDSPFLIIVTDTNNNIITSNETDYILISNSSSVNKVKESGVHSVEQQPTVNKVNKIVDKVCIELELCNDETVIPYFESTKTIRTNVQSSNKTNAMDNVYKPSVENSKIIQILQGGFNDEFQKLIKPIDVTKPNETSQSNIENIQIKPNSTNKLQNLDSSHVYESLKTPLKSDSKIKDDVEASTPQSITTNQLLHIMQPTSKLYTSTPVYNPKKTTSPRTPILTTTKRISTHSSLPNIRPVSGDSGSGIGLKPNDYYSIEPSDELGPKLQLGSGLNFSPPPMMNQNGDYFGSSTNSENQFGTKPNANSYYDMDPSTFVRFPNDPAFNEHSAPKQYPNSKFLVDFQNSYTFDTPQGASNSYIRFPTNSRTPASTYNSNRWSNTRWPPQQQMAAHDEQSWNSRWPPPPQQQYYNQNSRYQQNIPVVNY